MREMFLWVLLMIPAVSEPFASSTAGSSPCCPVVELRQYTLHPGMRDSMLSLFEREFIETQEATGIQVMAQFRDIDRLDTFTWLRGFPSLDARKTSLGDFYGGPVWAAHREAANGTIVSSDNVRLLRPATNASAFRLGERPAPGSANPTELIVATIYTLAAPASEGFAAAFTREIVPTLAEAGIPILAMFETEPGANTFPWLPVREGEHAFVWFARFADVAAYDRWKAGTAGSSTWQTRVVPVLDRYRKAPAEVFPVEIMRLVPTTRSHRLLSP